MYAMAGYTIESPFCKCIFSQFNSSLFNFLLRQLILYSAKAHYCLLLLISLSLDDCQVRDVRANAGCGK